MNKLSWCSIAMLLLIPSFAVPAEKCGTFAQVERLWQLKRTRSDGSAAARPTMQSSVLTPNGKIRIHFDTTGAHEPAMVDPAGNRIAQTAHLYIDTLRMIFDSVWNAEITSFGFIPPPSDNGRGGGDEFDVYVQDLGAGLFGQTDIENDLPVGPTKFNQQYATFIRFDNDFGAGYRTKGIPAMMATAAHEFHHAVQVGGSGVWEEDHFYFYELCAEALENIIFADARDYIYDVRTYFANISQIPLFALRSQTSYRGYERAIWGMFLMKKFGTSVMKDLWDELRSVRPVQASIAVLNDRSTSVEREFVAFTHWNFFTHHRADPQYHTDATMLPAVSLFRTVTATPAISTVNIFAQSFTPHYIKAVNGNDSAFLLISTTDVADASSGAGQTFSASVNITSDGSSGYAAIAPTVYAEFYPSVPAQWSYSVIGSHGTPDCFPNPFNPATSSLLIPVNGIGARSDVTLTIIDAASLDVVSSQNARYTTFSGTQYAEWTGRDAQGSLVPSGIYLYVLSRGSTVNKGKFAVIR